MARGALERRALRGANTGLPDGACQMPCSLGLLYFSSYSPFHLECPPFSSWMSSQSDPFLDSQLGSLLLIIHSQSTAMISCMCTFMPTALETALGTWNCMVSKDCLLNQSISSQRLSLLLSSVPSSNGGLSTRWMLNKFMLFSRHWLKKPMGSIHSAELRQGCSPGGVGCVWVSAILPKQLRQVSQGLP